MALTRDYKQSFIERAQRDPNFAQVLLEGAAELFFSNEPTLGLMTLRDLTHATIGFETLAAEIKCPSKSVHRMLSARGNPSTRNLLAIFAALRKHLGVSLEVRCVDQVEASSRHVGIPHAATDDAGLA